MFSQNCRVTSDISLVFCFSIAHASVEHMSYKYQVKHQNLSICLTFLGLPVVCLFFVILPQFSEHRDSPLNFVVVALISCGSAFRMGGEKFWG